MNCVSTSVWKRDKDRQVLCATVWVCLCVFQHVWSARTYRVNIYCMNECFYTLTIVISLHSLLRPHRAFFGTMKDTFMPANFLSQQCMNVKYVVLPHIATLLNAECTSGMCFFVCLFFFVPGCGASATTTATTSWCWQPAVTAASSSPIWCPSPQSHSDTWWMMRSSVRGRTTTRRTSKGKSGLLEKRNVSSNLKVCSKRQWL